MLSRIVIGTLSTLNTLMAPLAGTQETPTTVLRLEPQGPGHCRGIGPGALNLSVRLESDNHLELNGRGSICESGGLAKHVVFSLKLPGELADDRFLENLPLGSAYVLTHAPGQKDAAAKTRMKLTKRQDDRGVMSVLVEWIPASEFDRPEREPITIWLKKIAGRTTNDVPWDKIEFSEIGDGRDLKITGRFLTNKPL